MKISIIYLLTLEYYFKVKGRRPWQTKETEAIMKFFAQDIKLGAIPNKKKATECLEQSKGNLSRRTWRDVKFFVYNKIKKNKNSNK